MLIVNTITQSGAFDYTQSVRSGAFVTLGIEHCLTAFCDVRNHQQLLQYFYTDRSKAVLLLLFLTVLAVCVYTLVQLLC